MKTIFRKILVLGIVISIQLLNFKVSNAQSPQLINYQAVVRNASGEPIVNQNVSVRISILRDNASGTLMYSETHSPITNALGLVNLSIGGGTVQSGNMSSIDWGNHLHFVQVEIDINGGSNYALMGTSQLLSVPYSLYAEKAGNVPVVPSSFDTDSTNELQTLNLNGNTLSISNGNNVTLPTFTDTDEQTITFNNATGELTISNGNTITLPTTSGGDNWGSQVVATNATLTGNGTSGNPLGVNESAVDNQTLSLNSNQLTIDNGNSVSLSSYLDNTDEQTLAINNNQLTISNGNTITLPTMTDTDDQTLSLSGNTLSIQDGNTVSLSSINTDNQDLSLSGNTLSITNDVTTVSLAAYLDNTDAQTLSLNGNDLSITGGNTITLPSGTVDTDDQTLSFSGNTLSIQDGNNVNLSSLLDNTDAQTLSLNGNDLTISGGNTITIPSSTNYWTLSGNNLYNNSGTKVGINTTSPSEKFHVSNGVLLHTGTYSSDSSMAVSGAGTRMFFYPRKAAFRAGNVSGVHWNDSEIGNYSVAFGKDNVSKGDYSFTAGNSNTVTGSGSAAVGNQNTASGSNSFAAGSGNTVLGSTSAALGSNNVADGDNTSVSGSDNTAVADNSFIAGSNNVTAGSSSIAMGAGNTAVGDRSFALGTGNDAPSYSEMVVGTYASTYSANSSSGYNSADRIFSVGNGQSGGARSNALTVLKGGNVGIGITSPTKKLEVSGTTKTDSLQAVNIRMTNGAVNGYVLTSDASGNASWATVASSLPTAGTGLSYSGSTLNSVWTTSGSNIYNNNSGNVGIGTSSPNARLHVYSNSGASSLHVQSTTSNAYLNLNNGGSGFESSIATYTNGTQRWSFGKSNGAESGSDAGSDFFLNRYNDAGTFQSQPIVVKRSTGYVGINKGNPTKQLEVSGTTKTDSLQAVNIKMSNGANSGYVLTSDASGNGYWAASSSSTPTKIQDADANTTVETEQSANENFIRFTLNGTEYYRINKATIEVNNSGKCVYMGASAGASDNYTYIGTNNENTGIGANALQSVTTTGGSTALGAHALQSNSSGRGNTAIGNSALRTNTSGSDNVAAGYGAGYYNTGSNNLLLGYAAGYNNTGSNNLLLGYGAGYNNTGSGNVFLGYNAGYSESGSNKLYIANSNTSTPLIYGDFSSGQVKINSSLLVGDFSSTSKFEVRNSVSGSNWLGIIYNTNNTNTDYSHGLGIQAGHDTYNASKQSHFLSFWRPDGTPIGAVIQNGSTSVNYYSVSDQRLKTNVQPTRYGLAQLMKIQVRDYTYKDDPANVQTGFLAQQLYESFPAAVHIGGEDLKKNPWMVDYGKLTPVLVQSVQDQQKIIDDLRKEIENLKFTVEQLMK